MDKNIKKYFTCVFGRVKIHDSMKHPTGITFRVKASHGGTDGKPTIIAPSIIKNIVPGVKTDDAKKSSW